MGVNALSLNKALAQRILPLCLCGILGTALLFPVSSHAQSNDVLNRLKQMENDISTLNRAVYKGETPPPSSGATVNNSAAADLEVRLGQIETDMRNLTGKVEQQSYDMQQMQQKLDALSQESKMRLDAIEGQPRTGAVPPQQQPPVPMMGQDPAMAPGFTGDEANVLPNPATDVTGAETGGAAVDAAGLYEQGYALIKKEDYAGAEKIFASFMKQYPTHSLAPNALYWLGETYYARKDYDKSSRVFAEAYQKYPGGPKGADNLLKLGLSLAGKGEKDNACIALGQLKKEYPKGPDPVLKKGEAEMATLGCK